MTDSTTKKVKAAAKMAFGSFKIGSAILTGTGHGLLGGALRQHHMMGAAAQIAKRGVEGGKRTFDEGLAEWKEAE